MTSFTDLSKLVLRTALPTLGAMGLAGLSFFVAQHSLALGVAVGAAASLLLFPLMDGYVDLVRRRSMTTYRFLQVMLVVAIPVNVWALATNGVLPDLSMSSGGSEAAFDAVGLLGWGIGGSLVLMVSLLRPRPPVEPE
ncbi:MAG: hypothetical protein GY913_04665 [Proteobacteria bacterium]|nr:hypothetical protein [Pseudomonadota bacterium]MCP4916193.1 hypothetical protein [Pseudomonadota bacterium]